MLWSAGIFRKNSREMVILSKLSYAGRIQLINWVFNGKVNFLVQAIRLPKKTLRRIWLIGYNFLSNGWKGATWDKVTFAKEEGGLGI